jgi:hypothetical protein
VAGVVVVPGGGGQGQDALQDPGQDVGRGAAAIPHLRAAGGGSIILAGSALG